MHVPAALAKVWSHEAEWLEALPRLSAECAAMWDLELEDPFDTPNSLVIPTGATVLKLNAPSHFEADTEVDALESWNGNGAVRLLARDDARRALLVERCVPGTQLWDAGVNEATVVGALLPRLQVDMPGSHPFRLLAEEAERWAHDVPTWYDEAGKPFERVLIDFAVDVYRSASRSAAYLVNQDLHGGNILRAEREPWLVIDPKPLVGERELESSGLLRNAASASQLLKGWVDPSKSVSHWLDVLEDVGFDRNRARAWGVAHNLAWAWDERDGWSREQVAIADRILNAP